MTASGTDDPGMLCPQEAVRWDAGSIAVSACPWASSNPIMSALGLDQQQTEDIMAAADLNGWRKSDERRIRDDMIDRLAGDAT